jgi:hypothetical protein
MGTESQIYSQEYRHFDTLIWQVQTWASGIFALTITASSVVIQDIEKIEKVLPINALRALAIFLTIVFAVLLLLSNVLVRFRIHQGALGELPTPRLPRAWWQPPGQTSLLLIIFLVASAILSFALIVWGISPDTATILSLIFLFGGFFVTEQWTRRTYRAFRTMKKRVNEDG